LDFREVADEGRVVDTTHGILAVFLLGAITHQAVGAAWPVTKRSPGFVGAIRSVNGMNYTNVVIGLFVVTFPLGCIPATKNNNPWRS
jgi:hypothetical protein